jgi:hypothetical protein
MAKLLLLVVAAFAQELLPEAEHSQGRRLSLNKFEKRTGLINWLLIASYNETAEITGKVFALPSSDINNEIEIISGNLTKPVGLCFNSKDDYLYVIDQDNETSRILQYKASWDLINYFEIKQDPVVIIDKETLPLSCDIDAHGNLWYVDSLSGEVNVVNFIDLLSETINQNIKIYTSDDSNVNEPFLIDIFDNDVFYFINTYSAEGPGQLVKAATLTNLTDIGDTTQYDFGFDNLIELVIGDEYGFFSLETGELYSFLLTNPANVSQKTSASDQLLTGLCFGDNQILIADHFNDKIYVITENPIAVPLSLFISFDSPYKLFCVNSAVAAAVSLVFWVLW